MYLGDTNAIPHLHPGPPRRFLLQLHTPSLPRTRYAACRPIGAAEPRQGKGQARPGQAPGHPTSVTAGSAWIDVAAAARACISCMRTRATRTGCLRATLYVEDTCRRSRGALRRLGLAPRQPQPCRLRRRASAPGANLWHSLHERRYVAALVAPWHGVRNKGNSTSPSGTRPRGPQPRASRVALLSVRGPLGSSQPPRPKCETARRADISPLV